MGREEKNGVELERERCLHSDQGLSYMPDGTEHHFRAVHDIPSWQRSKAACDTTEISIKGKTQSRKEWT